MWPTRSIRAIFSAVTERAVFRALVFIAVTFTFCCPALAQDTIWTNKPVRVDPSQQDFQRLPNLVLGLEGGESISFPTRIDMRDSARFAAAGVEYALAGLKGIAPGRLCTSETGARWPCGTQASVFVSNLFRGRTLVCKVERSVTLVMLSGCRTTQMRIPFEIVAQGFAFPAGGDGDLEAAVSRAKAQRAGVWKDAVCAGAAHSC